MNTPINRRRFIQHAAYSAALTAALTPTTTHTKEPFTRSKKPRLSTSIAAYSFRNYFINATHQQQKQIPQNQRITLFNFLDYCADQGCNGAELTSYYFPKKIDKTYLLQLKHHAFLRGIAISGTAVGNTFTHPPGQKRNQQIQHVKHWIDHAQTMGAPHIRVFAGNQGNQNFQTALKHCIDTLQECGNYAAQRGIFLGIENHGGIVAQPQPLLKIVQTISNPWIGINLDTGNFHTNDPYADIQKCAPYALNIQLKVQIKPRHQKHPTKTNIQRIIQILKTTHYQGYITLEHEAPENPWKTIPNYLAEINQHIHT